MKEESEEDEVPVSDELVSLTKGLCGGLTPQLGHSSPSPSPPSAMFRDENQFLHSHVSHLQELYQGSEYSIDWEAVKKGTEAGLPGRWVSGSGGVRMVQATLSFCLRPQLQRPHPLVILSHKTRRPHYSMHYR